MMMMVLGSFLQLVLIFDSEMLIDLWGLDYFVVAEDDDGFSWFLSYVRELVFCFLNQKVAFFNCMDFWGFAILFVIDAAAVATILFRVLSCLDYFFCDYFLAVMYIVCTTHLDP
ncbi:hypothetical protein Droror1_Dr00003401 [Drosera rotundifolia]